MQVILNKPGTRLHRKAGAFEILTSDGAHKLAVSKVDSFLITAKIRITSDAILLAVENGIDILFVDGMGNPQARVWSHRFGSISTIRKQQIVFGTHVQGMVWIKEVLKNRVDSQGHLLRSLMRDRPAKVRLLESATEKIAGIGRKFESISPAPLNDNIKAQFRGWEGAASRIYFSTLSQILPEMYRFNGRSRRPAKDLFNCALNYCYGILYGKVELSLIKAGVDPFLGVFHRDEYNRPVLVYDMIELYRVWAETVVLQLCFRRVMGEEMVSSRKGGLWLEALGKKVVISAMNDFLAEVVQYKHKRRSRVQHIQEDAHELAKQVITDTQDDIPF
ncbi:MAG: CRISPR-associated endonuclease Cas1 [Bacteroidota bacterium]